MSTQGYNALIDITLVNALMILFHFIDNLGYLLRLAI